MCLFYKRWIILQFYFWRKIKDNRFMLLLKTQINAHQIIQVIFTPQMAALIYNKSIERKKNAEVKKSLMTVTANTILTYINLSHKFWNFSFSSELSK